MNQYLVAHVTAEVVIVGGLSYYFMKKTKQAEEQIKLLETRLQDLDSKVKSADKHIQTLYQMIEGLAEQSAPPPPRRGGFMPHSTSRAGAESLRNRKQKMRVIPMPVEEDEEILELEPSNGSFVPNQSGGPSSESPFNAFPLGAIFEMMGPGPMGGFFQSSPPSQEPPVVVEDDDDDQDIQDELKELGVDPEHDTSK